MDATPSCDDDNFCEFMGMQPKWGLWFTPFNGYGEAIRMKPVFAF